MQIGVPKEIKNNEFRVGLTPGAVRAFTQAGHEVLVERGAGLGSGFPDEEYLQAGARILDIEYENRGRVEVEIRDGSIQKEVVFTSDNAGSYAWVQTSCDVRWKDIPKAVADTIENNRKGAEIDDVDFIETPSGNYYLVELEMHSADIYLKIDEQGTVLNA